MKRVAIVTGGSRGLGRAISESLSERGYMVALGYNKSEKEAKEASADLQKGSLSFYCNLGDDKQVGANFKKLLRHFGRVDLLVNNVGDFLYQELGKTTNSQFRNVMESNLYATLFASRAVLPMMRKQKSGQIVNIGAVGCERIVLRKKVIPYYLAKNGVYVLTKAMAWEEARHGVRINMISPGSMETDIFKGGDFPMQRETKYGDVVSALLFLISGEAYYINGGNIEVAGGFIPGME